MTADVSGSEAEVTLQSGQRRGWLQVQPIYGQWRRLQMLLKLFKPEFDFALFGNGLVVHPVLVTADQFERQVREANRRNSWGKWRTAFVQVCEEAAELKNLRLHGIGIKSCGRFPDRKSTRLNSSH